MYSNLIKILQKFNIDFLYLSDKIYQRDLKPENVLICKEDNANPTMKITDMCHSKLVDLSTVLNIFCFTPQSNTPCRYRGQHLHPKGGLLHHQFEYSPFPSPLVRGLHYQPEQEKEHQSWKVWRTAPKRSRWTTSPPSWLRASSSSKAPWPSLLIRGQHWQPWTRKRLSVMEHNSSSQCPYMGKIAAKEKHQVPKKGPNWQGFEGYLRKGRQVYYWFYCLTSFLHFIRSLKSYNMNNLLQKKRKKKGGPMTGWPPS